MLWSTITRCGRTRAIDLRTLDRHSLTSIGTLVLSVPCSLCPSTNFIRRWAYRW